VVKDIESIFHDKFGGGLASFPAGGDVYYSKGGVFYVIPAADKYLDIRALMEKSLAAGKDLLFERYGGHELEYIPNADY
jgi:hypothetical protein